MRYGGVAPDPPLRVLFEKAPQEPANVINLSRKSQDLRLLPYLGIHNSVNQNSEEAIAKTIAFHKAAFVHQAANFSRKRKLDIETMYKLLISMRDGVCETAWETLS